MRGLSRQDIRPDAAADLRDRRLLRVPRQVRVARRRPDDLVAEQLSDHRQSLAQRQRARGIRMPEIVQAHILQSGPRPQRQPYLVDVYQMAAGPPARDHPGIARNAGDAIEHRLDLGRQRDHARAGLRIPQPQGARAPVHIVPTQRQDLVAPAPGQHQQADRGNGRGPQRAVRFSLVHEPAQPAVLIGRQIPFVLLARPIHAHRPARVPAVRRQPPRLGKSEQSREHADRRVGPRRRAAKLVVQCRHLGAVHRADGKLA